MKPQHRKTIAYCIEMLGQDKYLNNDEIYSCFHNLLAMAIDLGIIDHPFSDKPEGMQ
jgi:hypothetical protein